MTSVLRSRPSWRREWAARLEAYPPSHKMIQRIDVSTASGIRASLRGSNRHSRWLRSITIAPGTSPAARLWNSGRMSTRYVPVALHAGADELRARAESLLAGLAPLGLDVFAAPSHATT